MQWGHPQPRSGEGDAQRDEVGVPPACGGEPDNQT
jgi:hypothetical protein